MSEVRSALDRTTRDDAGIALSRRLAVLLAAVRPAAVVGYVPIGSEIDPSAVVEAYADAGVPTYAPRWRNERAEFAHRATGAHLDRHCERVAILVPGIAFDPTGTRLGRGGGWYDRILTRYPAALRIGCAYDRQVLPSVPRDTWDVTMDYVVTEARSLLVSRVANPARECAHEWH